MIHLDSCRLKKQPLYDTDDERVEPEDLIKGFELA
jgi:hypothetical protein